MSGDARERLQPGSEPETQRSVSARAARELRVQFFDRLERNVPQPPHATCIARAISTLPVTRSGVFDGAHEIEAAGAVEVASSSQLRRRACAIFEEARTLARRAPK